MTRQVCVHRTIKVEKNHLNETVLQCKDCSMFGWFVSIHPDDMKPEDVFDSQLKFLTFEDSTGEK